MKNSHNKTVLILGANGRFGRNAANAFHAAGWEVLSHTRVSSRLSDDVAGTHTPFDIENSNAFEAEAQKCAVIVNALNPQYPDWPVELPKITRATVKAARASGATIMIPGNVYNFGAAMPPLLNENTPQIAKTKKGKLRIEMEQAYQTAAKDGVQTINLRSGDFFERKQTGAWFDTYLVTKVGNGKFAYPGKHHIDHAWAYLPDTGRAMVALAEIRETLALYEDVPFEGTNISASALTSKMSKTLGHNIQITNVPWIAIKIMGLLNPIMREVLEMRYLWDVEHAVDGSKIARLLPNFQPTRLEDILHDILADYKT